MSLLVTLSCFLHYLPVFAFDSTQDILTNGLRKHIYVMMIVLFLDHMVRSIFDM